MIGACFEDFFADLAELYVVNTTEEYVLCSESCQTKRTFKLTRRVNLNRLMCKRMDVLVEEDDRFRWNRLVQGFWQDVLHVRLELDPGRHQLIKQALIRGAHVDLLVWLLILKEGDQLMLHKSLSTSWSNSGMHGTEGLECT